MTPEQQALADDKMRAEIANLVAQSTKLAAETAKINRENNYYPLVVGGGVMAAAIALARLLFQTP